jgi:MFS family permease
VLANSFYGWIIGMSFRGIGIALVYPTLLAAISDIAHPRWRATSLGIYRFWRELGFVFSAAGIGFIACLAQMQQFSLCHGLYSGLELSL